LKFALILPVVVHACKIWTLRYLCSC